MNTNDNRQAYTAGLRKLADLIDKHPELPMPYIGYHGGSELLWIETDDAAKSAAVFARVIPGEVNKRVRGTAFDLVGTVEGLAVKMIVDRDDVCERVVVDTREVTREVPDPSVAIPMVTETVTEDIVEWRCRPILAGGES